MLDVQNDPSSVPMRIDRVGVKDFRLPLVVSDRRQGRQHTVARVDLGVELPAHFKGTHMSRFVEILHENKSMINMKNFPRKSSNWKLKIRD